MTNPVTAFALAAVALFASADARAVTVTMLAGAPLVVTLDAPAAASHLMMSPPGCRQP